MDRIKLVREFKRVLWTCPICQLEDFEDRPMNGGASYEHTCKNGHKFNQSCGAMKEYNGALSYTPEEYENVTEEEVSNKKDDCINKWIYDLKNPPIPQLPTKDELEKQKAELEAQVANLTQLISSKSEVE